MSDGAGSSLDAKLAEAKAPSLTKRVAMAAGTKEESGARRGSIKDSLEAKNKEGSIKPLARRPSQRNVLAMDEVNVEAENFREQLDSVQKTGMYFHGFDEDEVDFLVDFLSYMTFTDGELIAAKGEEASWCGILLTGLLDAVLEDGTILGTLRKGQIVGEMALFRGGKRMCDMVGQGSGALGALLFADLPAMYRNEPRITQKLMAKFGMAASSKLVFPHKMPEPASAAAGAPSAARALARRAKAKSDGDVKDVSRAAEALDNLPAGPEVLSDLSVRHQVAAKSLEERGLEKLEAIELLKSLVLLDFTAGQLLLQRDHTLGFIGIVLRGSILDGKRERGIGELVGEWWALSGYPISHNVVGGPQGGSIGLLSLDKLAVVGEADANLAIKMMKLIGIGATSTAADKDKEVRLGKVELGNKATELLYKNKMKSVEATMEVVQQAAEEMEGYKKRNDILYKKLKRAHDTAVEKLADKEKEAKDKDKELKSLSKQAEKNAKDLLDKSIECENLKKAIAMADSETKKLAEIQQLQNQLSAKSEEIAGLQSDLDALDRENVEAHEAFELRLARAERQWQHDAGRLQAQWRWRWAITAVQLDSKARIVRRAETRAMVVHFLSKGDLDQSALTLDAMNFELDATKAFLDDAEAERETLREAAASMESKTSSLEARHAELEATAKQAIARDRQLQQACQAAEEQAAAAQAVADELSAELSRLRWMCKQHEETLGTQAEALAATAHERDEVLNALERTAELYKASEAEKAESAARARESEASLLATRAGYSSRIADADRAARDGAAAVARMRTLERQLHEVERLRASDQQQQSKVALVLSRLSELEHMFGDMLAPVSARAHSYLSALQELVHPEVKITPSFQTRGHHGNLPPPPPLVVAQFPTLREGGGPSMAPAPSRPRGDEKPSTMDGRAPPSTAVEWGEGAGAAAHMHRKEMRAADFSPRRPLPGAPVAAVSQHLLADRSPRRDEAMRREGADATSPTRSHALAPSASLPVLRTPSLPAAAHRKVARGAVRVAARQGVSVGELKQARAGMLANAQPLDDVIASMHRERPPPLPTLPVGAIYRSEVSVSTY